MKRYALLCAFFISTVSFTHFILAQTTSYLDSLAVAQKRGYLICGVSQGLTGFSSLDNQGNWQGLDVDFCRAVAAAALGDSHKVKFVPLSAEERFTALQSGDIDILSRNTTWTLQRDTELGLSFVGVLFYDAQGLMVKKSDKINHAIELDGATICSNRGTTTELNIADFFRTHHLKYQIVTFVKTDETLAAYEAGRCDVYSTDISGIAAQRLKFANKEEHIILPDRISKEPFSPMVRQGDEQWEKIVKWTLFALINAEEMQISKTNIDEKLKAKDSVLLNFMEKASGLQEEYKIKPDWVYQVIKQVGNYGEIYDTNVGKDSPLKLERGLNALWNQGGILYAPPFR
jgi:general L-amino acid transport system substrate-binding protein